MARSPLTERRDRLRRRERVTGELRNAVLALCIAAGVVASSMWALGPTLDRAQDWRCKRPDDDLGACVGDVIGALLAPAVAKLAVGVLAGFVVALVLFRTVPALRRRDPP